MINYNKIVILENDQFEIPSWLRDSIKSEIVPVTYWYNFSIDLSNNFDKSIEKLRTLNEPNTLFLCSPSFVGEGNSFSSYVYLFMQLKEKEISLNLHLVYNDPFDLYCVNYMYDDKRRPIVENKLRMLCDVFNYHTISFSDIYNNNITIKEKHTPLLSSTIEKYYVKVYHNCKDSAKIKTSNEIYKIIYINIYVDKLEDVEVELLISENPFVSEKYKFSEITIINNID